MCESFGYLPEGLSLKNGRGDRISTCGLLLPKQQSLVRLIWCWKILVTLSKFLGTTRICNPNVNHLEVAKDMWRHFGQKPVGETVIDWAISESKRLVCFTI